MSDTPRTSEAQFGTGRVSVSFAAQLERELNEAKEVILSHEIKIDNQNNTCRDLRDELDEANAKIIKLENWKSQQLAVESEWDAQATAKLLGSKLGQSCRQVIAKRVPELITELNEANADRLRLRECVGCGCGGDFGLCRTCEEALTTPPPPVVAKADADELVKFLEWSKQHMDFRISNQINTAIETYNQKYKA